MSENTESKTMTTAAALGSYRKELIEQGFAEREVNRLVGHASIILTRDGLVVKS